jgi:predicted nicotinamide N-methyase
MEDHLHTRRREVNFSLPVSGEGGARSASGGVVDRTAFILANTAILAPPLVPEVELHLATEAVPLWQKTEEELGEIGLPPPFWAFAWAGGQALARYVLDNPQTVRGLRVLDLASGSGLVAIAAMKAGAAHVLAADIDDFAAAAMTLNAAHNHVALSVTTNDLLGNPPPDCDVILVGDLFYEQTIAARLLEWLVAARAKGTSILIGDPSRSYLPKARLAQLATYSVPVTRDLEDAEIKQGAVWTLNSFLPPAGEEGDP